MRVLLSKVNLTGLWVHSQRGDNDEIFWMLFFRPIIEVVSEYQARKDDRTLVIYLSCLCCGYNHVLSEVGTPIEDEEIIRQMIAGKLVLTTIQAAKNMLSGVQIPNVEKIWDPYFKSDNCFEGADEFKTSLRKIIDKALIDF